tara:strand:- start:1858 stop:2037 length:180 start_codon:yes stop_codon:yes gene_type:complete
MSWKNSNLNVPDDMMEYRSENHIDLSIQILELLKGKTVSEIKDICVATNIIAQKNAKLL